MFALTDRKSGLSREESIGDCGMRVSVLPRPMRRMVRFLRALVAGDVFVPRYAGTVSLAVLFGATAAAGMVLGGHTHKALEATGSAFGFAVSKVVVNGNRETSDIDVLQQLHLDGDTSIFTLNLRQARQALLDLPWVADAKVQKIYPNKIEVDLKERKAFAIWQHGQNLSLIERNGSVIVPFVQGTKFAALPQYVGLGAETEASRFNGILTHWPDLVSRVRAIVRIGERRWNLVFDHGVTVKLPDAHVAQALADLDAMQKKRDILGRNIVAVDLRLPDRVTVQLSPAAAAARKAGLEARDKALKKAERQAWKIQTAAGGKA